MGATKYIKNAFAITGDKIAVPNVAPGDGTVGYNTGWGSDYQLDLFTDPNALPIPRPQSNQVLYDVTLGLQQYQQKGTPNWISPTDNDGTPYSYGKYDLALYDTGTGDGPQIWRSMVSSNISVPGADANWVLTVQDGLTWSPEYTYGIDNIVFYNGILWKSLIGTGNINRVPGGGSGGTVGYSYWAALAPYTDGGIGGGCTNSDVRNVPNDTTGDPWVVNKVNFYLPTVSNVMVSFKTSGLITTLGSWKPTWSWKLGTNQLTINIDSNPSYSFSLGDIQMFYTAYP